MGTTVALLDAVSQRAWPVIAMVTVALLIRNRLLRAICWNLVLRAMKVPLAKRQSIVTRVAHNDLDLNTRAQKPAIPGRAKPCHPRKSRENGQLE